MADGQGSNLLDDYIVSIWLKHYTLYKHVIKDLYIFNVIYFVVDYFHILCVLNYTDSNVSNSGYHHNHHQKQDLCSIIDKYIFEGAL
jgi:hypothetical protein